MDECELIALVTAIACTISKNCPEDDIVILAAIFSQLGDTLTTVLTQRELKEKKSNSNSDSEEKSQKNQYDNSDINKCNDTCNKALPNQSTSNSQKGDLSTENN